MWREIYLTQLELTKSIVCRALPFLNVGICDYARRGPITIYLSDCN